VVERLAGLTGMTAWGALRGRSLAFLSAVPIPHHRWHRPRWSKHAFIELQLEGARGRIFGVHLSALHWNWTERRRTYELRALLADIAPHASGFHLLAGDFNTLAPDERLDPAHLPLRLRPFIWMSGGTIRWQTIRRMLDAGYVDGYRHFHLTEPGYTFPTWNPHVRLDYAFVPRAFVAKLTACQVVTDVSGAGQASDHFPLLVEFE
jgi:exodeoxyribonuclease-3